MYQEITKDIEINVDPFFVPEQSEPEQGYFLFAYRVRITNNSEKPTKLLSRHWIVTDGNCRIEEIIGQGVVGEQPMLNPGESFEYTSSCQLPTPTGNMRGWYHMRNPEGERFKVKIPVFFLRHPNTFH